MKVIFLIVVIACVNAFSPRLPSLKKVVTQSPGQLDQPFRGNSVLTSTVQPVDSMAAVDDNWKDLANVGQSLTNLDSISIFWRGLVGGIFVGTGGILTASIGFDMGVSPSAAGQGLARFFTGAIGFPLSIILVSVMGAGAWTGDLLLASRASQTKNVPLEDTLRHLILMWLGSMTGATLVGAFASGAGLACLGPCVGIAAHKLSHTPWQIFLRAVGAGMLINLAVFMQRLNRSMVGKAIAIWFPISTYVMCDYEHVLATQFFFTAAKCHGATFPLADMVNFLFYSTLGNLVGGAFVTGGLIANIRKMPRQMLETGSKKATEMQAQIEELRALLAAKK